MSLFERRRARGMISVLLAASLIAIPQSALAAVPDPERNSQAVTPWGWHYGVAPATINAFVSQGYRIIDLEVSNASPLRFSAAYVRDSGVYDRTWWWYYGLTANGVASRLTANNARLIDIEPYLVNGGLRFAAVMVRNTGDAQKTWWWYYGQTVAGIGDKATANHARVVDVDRYATSAGSRFAVIMIRNAGVDAASWWHYYNVTSAFIANNLHGRLIDIERIGNDRFDVVMQGGGGAHWWWYYGLTAAQVTATASQLGARIYRIEPYGSRFAVLLINDVNAETTRIRDLVGNDLEAGAWGFYVKKVGGGVVLDLNGDTVFEPASAIKAAHAVLALRRVRDDPALTLTSNVTWYAKPGDAARYPGQGDYADDKNKCAYTNAGTLQTGATYSDDIGPVVIKNMLEQSDNRLTDALVRRFGFAAINATIDSLGMTKSHLYHRVGCPAASSPQPWRHNRLTLRDIAHLYELVQNGTALGTGTYRDTFWEYMAGGTLGNGALRNMIISEANAAGLSAAERADFLGRVVTYSKGGSYGLCPDGGGSCNPPTWQIRTAGGIIYLPFKNARGGIVRTAYVYGRFLDHWQSNCTFAQADNGNCAAWNTASDAFSTIGVEMFRKIVKDALASW